jgi:hypothetical protein
MSDDTYADAIAVYENAAAAANAAFDAAAADYETAAAATHTANADQRENANYAFRDAAINRIAARNCRDAAAAAAAAYVETLREFGINI